MESASGGNAAGTVSIFFIDYLHASGLLDEWVSSSPLQLTSPNAPTKIDVLGTVLLSVLSGHQRYTHINALRGDCVNPGLLGISKVVSEDPVRHSFGKMEDPEGVIWLQDSLHSVYAPLLDVPWILAEDTTVKKTVYCRQEGA